MRVSIWLYILEQTSLTSCLLLAVGLSAGLRRQSPLRLTLVSLVTAFLGAVMADAPELLRVSALAAVLFERLDRLIPQTARRG